MSVSSTLIYLLLCTWFVLLQHSTSILTNTSYSFTSIDIAAGYFWSSLFSRLKLYDLCNLFFFAETLSLLNISFISGIEVIVRIINMSIQNRVYILNLKEFDMCIPGSLF